VPPEILYTEEPSDSSKMSADSDSRIRSFLAGDDEQSDYVVNLVNLILRELFKDEHVPDDEVRNETQEVITSLLQTRSRGEIRYPTAYLRSATHHNAIRYLKKRKAQRTWNVPFDDPPESLKKVPDDEWMKTRRVRDVLEQADRAQVLSLSPHFATLELTTTKNADVDIFSLAKTERDAVAALYLLDRLFSLTDDIPGLTGSLESAATHPRGGVLEHFYRASPMIRSNPGAHVALSRPLHAVVELGFRKLHESIDPVNAADNFSSALTLFKLVNLLDHSVAADAEIEMRKVEQDCLLRLPHLKALFLTNWRGERDDEYEDYWVSSALQLAHKGDTSAVDYLLMYTAPPVLGRRMMKAFVDGDRARFQQLISRYKVVLLGGVIRQGFENIDEPWYKVRAWAVANFARLDLVIARLGCYNQLGPIQKKRVRSVARSALLHLDIKSDRRILGLIHRRIGSFP
jgi:DNA-directed RNA polymerase specialized sigma24 family protein